MTGMELWEAVRSRKPVVSDKEAEGEGGNAGGSREGSREFKLEHGCCELGTQGGSRLEYISAEGKRIWTRLERHTANALRVSDRNEELPIKVKSGSERRRRGRGGGEGGPIAPSVQMIGASRKQLDPLVCVFWWLLGFLFIFLV